MCTHIVCVILDRYPIPGAGPKEEKFDMKIISKLIDLFRNLYSTVTVSIIVVFVLMLCVI